MVKKKIIFAIVFGMAIVFLLGTLIYSEYSGKDIKVVYSNMFGNELKGITSYSGDDFWASTSVEIINDTLVFTREPHQINITPTIIVAGEEYFIADKLNYHRERTEEGWKWTANITIPDTPTGGFIANNLEEIRFNIKSTVDLRKLKGWGFDYRVGTTRGEMYSIERRLQFSFEDIIQKFLNLPHYMIINSKRDIIAVANVTDITFSRGQTIELDPTIIISDVTTANAFLWNTTGESIGNAFVDFTHLTIGDNSIGFINDINLVLYMPFDMNASLSAVPDYTNLDNDGTINGDAHYVDEGIIGGAFEFDGDGDYLQIGTNIPASLNFNSNFSISFWLNPHDEGLPISVGSSSSSSGEQHLYSIRYNFGNSRIDFSIGNVSTKDRILGTPGSVAQNVWTHIFCQVNTTETMECFFNGVRHATTTQKTIVGAWTGTSNATWIGRSASAGSHLNATIDEFMIINKSLSATEVLSLYNNQSSRFFPQGTMEFIAQNISQSGSEDRVNITISTQSTLPFNSTLDARIHEILVSPTNYNDSTTGSPAAMAKDGILAYYHFDNRTGLETDTHIYDFSGHDNNATPISSFPVENGYYFGGFNFSGSTSLINVSTTLDFNDIDYSWSLWFNSTAIDAVPQALFKQCDTAVGESGYSVYTDVGGNVIFESCNPSVPEIFTPTGDLLAEDVWNHILIIRDNLGGGVNDVTIYMNGENQGTQRFQGLAPETSKTLILGQAERVTDGINFTFNGVMDEFIYFNRTLTNAEVRDIFVRGRFDITSTSVYKSVNATNTTAIFSMATSTTHVIPDFRFIATMDGFSFISPNLAGNVTLDTWTAPPADTCTYVSGNWNVNCYDNCSIVSNVTIDDNGNITFTGAGSFTNNANITNWHLTNISVGCRTNTTLGAG